MIDNTSLFFIFGAICLVIFLLLTLRKVFGNFWTRIGLCAILLMHLNVIGWTIKTQLAIDDCSTATQADKDEMKAILGVLYGATIIILLSVVALMFDCFMFYKCSTLSLRRYPKILALITLFCGICYFIFMGKISKINEKCNNDDLSSLSTMFLVSGILSILLCVLFVYYIFKKSNVIYMPSKFSKARSQSVREKEMLIKKQKQNQQRVDTFAKNKQLQARSENNVRNLEYQEAQRRNIAEQQLARNQAESSRLLATQEQERAALAQAEAQARADQLNRIEQDRIANQAAADAQRMREQDARNRLAALQQSQDRERAALVSEINAS